METRRILSTRICHLQLIKEGAHNISSSKIENVIAQKHIRNKVHIKFKFNTETDFYANKKTVSIFVRNTWVFHLDPIEDAPSNLSATLLELRLS